MRHPGRGANSAQLRAYNERVILQRLRRADVASKADLARQAQLTHTAVSSIVGSLQRAGLVQAAGRRIDGTRGQPAQQYRLNPKGAFGIGVRLDRTRIETVVADLSGRILGARSHDMLLPEPKRALEIVRRDVAALLQQIEPAERKRLAGIGLGQPYHLGRWLRELGLRADFRLWDEVDFATMLKQAVQLPVYCENDGSAAAIAELLFGVGHTEADYLYLFVGPALGGGIVLGGESLRGCSGNAADVGVLPVPHSRFVLGAERQGQGTILLSRASLNVLARHLRRNKVKVDGPADLQHAFERNHPLLLEWLDDCVAALAHAVRAAVSVLDVPVCVIDTDIPGDFVVELMRRLHAGLQAVPPDWRVTPRLLRGSFGADASALGAASLPMFFSFAPRTEVLRGEAAPISPVRSGRALEQRA